MSTLFSTIMVQSVIDMNLTDVNSSLDRIAVVMRNVVLIPVCSAHVVKLMTWMFAFIYCNYKSVQQIFFLTHEREEQYGYHYENETELKSWIWILESLGISVFDFETWTSLILKLQQF